jgi:hypothetical protein
MWKNMVDPRQTTWQYKTAHALFALDDKGYRHTLRICNSYCFSTATLVSRTRLNITFTRTLPAISKARGPAVGPTEASFLCSGYRSVVRRLGREADHSHEFSTEVRNGCNRISSRATLPSWCAYQQPYLLSSHNGFKVAALCDPDLNPCGAGEMGLYKGPRLPVTTLINLIHEAKQ